MCSIINPRMMYLFVAVLVTIVGLHGGVESVTCYECFTGDGQNCDDPFSGVGVTTCTGEICTKTKISTTWSGKLDTIMFTKNVTY